jgi:glycosyltransferase involved in cell wall biosynthesis
MPKPETASLTVPEDVPAVQIIDNLGLGGAQRLLETLASQYPKGRGLPIYSLSGGETPFCNGLRSLGARITLLADLRLWHPLSLPRLVRELRRTPEPVVHIHLTYATILGAPAARLAGKRVVVSLHNAQTVAGERLRAKVLRGLETLCLRRFTDCVVFVGANVERANRTRIGRTPGIVVANVIPAPSELPAAEREAIRREFGAGPEDLVVIATGRLSPQKDPLLLIRAFAAAQARAGNLYLWMVGDGPFRAEAEALAAELLPATDGAKARVRFLGMRDDVRRLLPAADIYALSSLWEGLPVALLEAMAAGLAIACTRVGDIPDFLPQDAALLVQAGDPAGFAAALERLATNPALRHGLAARALEAARPHCDVAGWHRTLQGIYADLA